MPDRDDAGSDPVPYDEHALGGQRICPETVPMDGGFCYEEVYCVIPGTDECGPTETHAVCSARSWHVWLQTPKCEPPAAQTMAGTGGAGGATGAAADDGATGGVGDTEGDAGAPAGGAPG